MSFEFYIIINLDLQIKIEVSVAQEFKYDEEAGSKGSDFGGHIEEIIEKDASFEIKVISNKQIRLLQDKKELEKLNLNIEIVSNTIVNTTDIVLDYSKFEKGSTNEIVEKILGISLKQVHQEEDDTMEASDDNDSYASSQETNDSDADPKNFLFNPDFTDDELKKWDELPRLENKRVGHKETNKTIQQDHMSKDWSNEELDTWDKLPRLKRKKLVK